MSFSFKIKCFGDDRVADSVNELHQALIDHYRGKDVGVLYKDVSSGLFGVVYLSIDGHGKIYESYGNGEILDHAKLCATLC